MNQLGYYEQALGMGDEPSYWSRLGSTVVTGVLGAFVATRIAPDKDMRVAVVGGALASIGGASIVESVVPLGDFLWGVPYWLRGIMISGGAGAAFGMFLKNQYEREMAFAYEMRGL